VEPERLRNDYMATTDRFGFGPMTETPLEPSLIPYAGEERAQARTQFGFAVGPERTAMGRERVSRISHTTNTALSRSRFRDKTIIGPVRESLPKNGADPETDPRLDQIRRGKTGK